MGNLTPRRRTIFTHDAYRKSTGQEALAFLTWQETPFDIDALRYAHSMNVFSPAPTIKLRTKFPPANNCQVNITDPALTAENVETSIIQFDEDWTTKPVVTKIQGKEFDEAHKHWSQCSSQDGEHYIYSASLKDQTLALKVETLQDDVYAETYNCKAASSVN